MSLALKLDGQGTNEILVSWVSGAFVLSVVVHVVWWSMKEQHAQQQHTTTKTFRYLYSEMKPHQSTASFHAHLLHYHTLHRSSSFVLVFFTLLFWVARKKYQR